MSRNPSSTQAASSGVVLVGYRGSGKTTVGRIVASRLGVPFWDSDLEIRARAGRSIREIFVESGESGFRDWEERVLADLCARGDRSVLAPGGGAVLREVNRARLKAHGTVIWLTADRETLARRIESDPKSREDRPALAPGGVLDELDAMIAQRAPLYQALADATLDASTLDPEHVADSVLALIAKANHP